MAVGDGILELVGTAVNSGAAGSIGEYLSTLSKGDPRAGDDAKNGAAAIRVHPSGKFLYCSNRVFQSGGVG
jgi:hypothetical protein